MVFAALGGGIFADGKSVTILDSTISDNLARTDQALVSHGGGIDNLNSMVTFNNVTIAENKARRSAAVPDIARRESSSAAIDHRDNVDTVSSADCAGSAKSTGYNLLLDPADGERQDLDRHHQRDPFLADLALNPPGTTDTQALGAGSPVLEKGNPGSPTGTSGHCLLTDQRGVKRPAGKCDIGAYQSSS